MLFLVMGVSGCGKSTVANQLCKTLDIPFIEADDYHPQVNIDKMKNGHPLNDDDRQPWLENLAKALQENEGKGAVLACSALKEKYRSTLNTLISKPLQVIYLKGSFDLIHKRMNERAGHFMPSQLLKSQFDALEEPQEAWVFDIEESPITIYSQIQKRLSI